MKLYSYPYVLLIALAGCALGTGKLTTSSPQQAAMSGGNGSCYDANHDSVSCWSLAAVYIDSKPSDDDSGSSYTIEPGGLGAQIGTRRGWGSATSGGTSVTGTALDVGLEVIYNWMRYGGSVEVGYTRQAIDDKDRTFSGWYSTARFQFNYGALGAYLGAGYVFSGTLDVSASNSMDVNALRGLGGLRYPLRLGWGSLTELMLTAELQHTQAVGDGDYSANAILGGFTLMAQP